MNKFFLFVCTSLLYSTICFSSETSALTEIELVDQISYHDQLYWNKGEPEISDQLYDKLIVKLRLLNPDHPLVTRINFDSPSYKVKHHRKMLSLQKAYDFSEVWKWAQKYCRSEMEELLIQPKYDGIAVDYTEGILSTRGNGTEGRNITAIASYVYFEDSTMLQKSHEPRRGELIFLPADFLILTQNMKRLGIEPYVNSRSAVVGIISMKLKNHSLLNDVKLTFMDFRTHEFTVSLQTLKLKWPSLKKEILSYPFPMDGIVIKLSDVGYSESLGSTLHHPRAAIAFKFPNERAVTALISVTWQCGKTKISPVAHFTKVRIGGVNITKASLHSMQYIRDNDIQLGDSLVVERAGSVIPYIKSSSPAAKRTNIEINNCPSCLHIVSRQGRNVMCRNPNCVGTISARLYSDVAKTQIKGLGPATIKKMVAVLEVRSIENICSLTIEQICLLNGFAQKSAKKLFLNIRKFKAEQLLK